MARRIEYIHVNPLVMKWLRESSGRSLKEVSERLGVSLQRISMWESGKAEPPLGALEKLARYYRRPLAAFMLPEPPAEPGLPQDFRAFPDAEKHPLSPKTRLAIRRARRLLAIAAQIMEDLREKARASVVKASLSDKPEVVASSERNRIGVALDEQLAWKANRYVAFRHWRSALEKLRVFVFQMGLRQDARGFSLYEGQLPAIVVNTTDVPNGRIFTLFHEYAHLLLDRTGICNLEEHGHSSTDVERMEVFCNRFAGAFLVPSEGFADNQSVRSAAEIRPLDDGKLVRIANSYKVSKEVIVLRMRTLGIVSQSDYEKWKALQHKPSRKRSDGGPTQVQRCLCERGESFISLVLDAKAKDVINYNDATEYLSLSLENYRKLGERIG